MGNVIVAMEVMEAQLFAEGPPMEALAVTEEQAVTGVVAAIQMEVIVALLTEAMEEEEAVTEEQAVTGVGEVLHFKPMADNTLHNK
jgi:hypothetical protein